MHQHQRSNNESPASSSGVTSPTEHSNNRNFGTTPTILNNTQLVMEKATFSPATPNGPTPGSPNKEHLEKEKSESAAYRAEIAGILAVNVLSVVGIVAVNKKIFKTPGFQFPSSLMTLHFLVTYAFVIAFHKFGYFTAKRIDTWHYAKLGAAQVGSVALVNLSLVYNDVGTYQLMKFLVIFVTCFLEYLFYRKVYSNQVYMVLSGLVVSISFATITSIKPSLTGIFFGLAGAVSTSYYQILNKYIQQEHKVSPLQLLQYEQPFSALWCAIFAVVTEPVGAMLVFEWTDEITTLIILSAICAFFVNVSVYLIIGKTSPITFSVVGHIKTVSIFCVGVLFLGEKFSGSQAFWMVIAFVMILLYGHYTSSGQGVVSENKPAPSAAAAPVVVDKGDDKNSEKAGLVVKEEEEK